ncbi:MAG: 50S ribosomal protein L20 [Thermotogae bacterium]|jgi:large subunit ribosomal protein L20|nr:50S ribosomal protein L20 [Thermotogota bacterium]MCL5033319.1 50S ribosomal protein L20 [Thermotogota bacterium]
MRVKRGITKRQRHNKVLNAVKGHLGARRRHYRYAKEAVTKSGINAYIGRKQKKRSMRSLWITRINIAARDSGLKYSDFMHGLDLAGVNVNRKILAQLAVEDMDAFNSYVEIAKKHLVNNVQ